MSCHSLTPTRNLCERDRGMNDLYQLRLGGARALNTIY